MSENENKWLHLGNTLAEWIKTSGLGHQNNAAAALGVTKQELSYWKTGKRPLRPAVINKIVDYSLDRVTTARSFIRAYLADLLSQESPLPEDVYETLVALLVMLFRSSDQEKHLVLSDFKTVVELWQSLNSLANRNLDPLTKFNEATDWLKEFSLTEAQKRFVEAIRDKSRQEWDLVVRQGESRGYRKLLEAPLDQLFAEDEGMAYGRLDFRARITAEGDYIAECRRTGKRHKRGAIQWLRVCSSGDSQVTFEQLECRAWDGRTNRSLSVRAAGDPKRSDHECQYLIELREPIKMGDSFWVCWSFTWPRCIIGMECIDWIRLPFEKPPDLVHWQLDLPRHVNDYRIEVQDNNGKTRFLTFDEIDPRPLLDHDELGGTTTFSWQIVKPPFKKYILYVRQSDS